MLNRAFFMMILLCPAVLVSSTGVLLAQDNICLQAHAHNDYLHDRPLLDALDEGFCSVEADIFLVDGQLLVGHSRGELTAERTLQALYLEPLRKRTQKFGGKVHPGLNEPFTLLIDIKAEGEATYAALDKLLTQYRDIFSYVEDGKLHKQAITAIISGERAFEVIRADPLRLAGVDGRLSDLDEDSNSNFMPLISDNWKLHFSWRGEGEFPEPERKKLAEIIAKAHQKNQRVRFWATPDKPEVWSMLQTSGADLINTDDLSGLSQFLQAPR